MLVKFFFSRPVTIRFQSSVTVTFTWTRSTFFWIGLPSARTDRPGAAADADPVFVAEAAVGAPPGFVPLAGAGGVTGLSRGSMWTFTSWAKAHAVNTQKSSAVTTGNSDCTLRKRNRQGKRVNRCPPSKRDIWNLSIFVPMLSQWRVTFHSKKGAERPIIISPIRGRFRNIKMSKRGEQVFFCT